MESVGQYLKEVREKLNVPLQDVNRYTNIDLSLLSRIENGKRLPTKEQVIELAKFYKCNREAVIVLWLSDKVVSEVKHDEKYALEALQVAKEKLQFGKSQTLFPNLYPENHISLESRRYIGNKAKLTRWIMDVLEQEAPEAQSFFDVFAGTASVSKAAMFRYEKVILNDLLYSNNVIYKGFFDNSLWRKDDLLMLFEYYNSLDPATLPDNYFSQWFGDKFFDYDNAKLIGYIREDLERRRSNLNEKEFAVALSSLLYSIDKIANTVGHFDAYIKKTIKKQKLNLRLIEQINCPNVEIFREDSNTLAKKINADIAYIDPPYNSRQYSRFYHIYENLVTWQKPKLYGVALKPEPENMSVYCTTSARDAFEDLIASLDVKYIAVSYNNTYASKSSSSKNKISLSEIEHIMKSRGETKVFECSHKFFNTGKTEFSDHKELLFITRVIHEKRSSLLSFSDVLRGR